MTSYTFLTAINDWASSCGITINVSKLNSPPGLLDLSHDMNAEKADSVGTGTHVLVDEALRDGTDDYIEFWIPDSLKKATFSFMENGEGGTGCIPEFADAERLLSFVQRETALFLLRNIHLPATDEWLYDHGMNYEVVEKKEFCGEAAFQAEKLCLQDWHFFEFQDAGGYDITLGISGLGDAATFHADEAGFLYFDQRGKGLNTCAKLTAWLESVITSKS